MTVCQSSSGQLTHLIAIVIYVKTNNNLLQNRDPWNRETWNNTSESWSLFNFVQMVILG